MSPLGVLKGLGMGERRMTNENSIRVKYYVIAIFYLDAIPSLSDVPSTVV